MLTELTLRGVCYLAPPHLTHLGGQNNRNSSLSSAGPSEQLDSAVLHKLDQNLSHINSTASSLDLESEDNDGKYLSTFTQVL